MSLRNRPNAFVRSMVDAATVRPFWTALMEMKQARVRMTRLAMTTTAPAPVQLPELAPAIAA